MRAPGRCVGTLSKAPPRGASDRLDDMSPALGRAVPVYPVVAAAAFFIFFSGSGSGRFLLLELLVGFRTAAAAAAGPRPSFRCGDDPFVPERCRPGFAVPA